MNKELTDKLISTQGRLYFEDLGWDVKAQDDKFKAGLKIKLVVQTLLHLLQGLDIPLSEQVELRFGTDVSAALLERIPKTPTSTVQLNFLESFSAANSGAKRAIMDLWSRHEAEEVQAIAQTTEDAKLLKEQREVEDTNGKRL